MTEKRDIPRRAVPGAPRSQPATSIIEAGHRLAAIFQAADAAQVTLDLKEAERPETDKEQELERRMREARAKYQRDYKRVRRRGEAWPIPRNPETGKRLKNTGRYPTTGLYSPIPAPSRLPAVSLEGRFKSRRERATELQERMRAFGPIYNAGWMVRDAYFGPDERRREKVMEFFVVLVQAAKQTDDYEALLFAIADTLYASSLGVPWEP